MDNEPLERLAVQILAQGYAIRYIADPDMLVVRGVVVDVRKLVHPHCSHTVEVAGRVRLRKGGAETVRIIEGI